LNNNIDSDKNWAKDVIIVNDGMSKLEVKQTQEELAAIEVK
jgi:hypothetical protein